ncbi:GntR family transcriptional regulator [Chloroflexota bacterium]
MTYAAVQPLRSNRDSLSNQAQQYLLGLIESGTYQPGEQLPSEAELAAQLGISRPTLREALLNLEQEGIIIRRHGVGTFVAPGYGQRLESGLERLESVLELAARTGMRLKFNALRIQEEAASEDLCEKLQIPAGTPLTHVNRVIVVDGPPVAYMEDVIPASVLPAAAIDETFNGSVLDLLRQKQIVQVARAVADIVALDADAPLAHKLAIKPGQAVLLLEEVLFDVEGKAVDCSRNYFVPDFFRFHVVRS